MKHYLFICTGNTCRSPMAEGIFRHAAQKKGLPIEVQSAGMGEDNQSAADNAILAMKEIGIDISMHRSRHLTPAMVRWADFILCMTRSHKDILVTMLGVPEEKVSVLGNGVPDPYGGDIDIYRQTRDALIEILDPLLPSFSIVSMSEEHVDILAYLDSLCIEEPWTAEGFLAELSKDTSYFRLALTDSDQVLGFCGTYIVSDVGDIAQIAVAPDARRQKIATWLLEDAIAECKRRGVTTLQLEVRSENKAARALYESFGFIEDGKRPLYYHNPSDDAILYSLNLKEETT